MEPVFDISKKDGVISYLLSMAHECRQPSGSELLSEVEKVFGWQVRWRICEIISEFVKENNLTHFVREYFFELLDKDSENSIFNALMDRLLITTFLNQHWMCYLRMGRSTENRKISEKWLNSWQNFAATHHIIIC